MRQLKMEHLGSIFLLIVGEEERIRNLIGKVKILNISVLHTTAIAIFFVEIIVAQAKYAKFILIF